MDSFESLSINYFIAGCVSGISSGIIGYPLETVKVRVQTMPHIGLFSHTISMLKHEGVTKGLFRGASYPLYTSGILSSLYFGVYGNSLRMIETARGQQQHFKVCCDDHLTPVYSGRHFDCFLAGCIGGVFATIVNTPIELVKTILQSGAASGRRSNKSSGINSTNQLTSTTCLLNIFKRRGVTGCFHGGLILMLRDVPTYGLYAVCYEHILCIIKTGQQDNALLRTSREGFAGGCSGVITWAIAIPVDVVKNRYMADGYNFDNRKYRGLLDCISKTYREHGVNVFYKGISIALLRAFPVSLVCFITYEQTLKICKYFQL